MKRFMILLLAACLLLGLMTGCGAQREGSAMSAPDGAASEGKLRVVTTIFPEYDWVRQIAGDQVELTMLLDNGVDLHSYQPTAMDMVTISDCDVFIYVGGESDRWVEDALKEASNEDMAVIRLLEALGDRAKEEEAVEGMETKAEEEAEEAEEEGPEYDEHVWLSLKNAQTLCQAICDTLSAKDPDHAETYQANTAAYLEKLSALDDQYQAAVDGAGGKTLLFGDRFPFRYLADDYGLTYYAAFLGCSAETEASFETIVFLAGQVDALGLKAILQIETSDGSIAKTIRENTQTKDQEILTMNSLQSTTSADVQKGATYLSEMERNLEVLKQALGA